MPAARTAYRLALVGADRAGKRTAQQYLAHKWGARSVELPMHSGLLRLSEDMFTQAGHDHPLLTITGRLLIDSDFAECRRHKFHIVELCRERGMIGHPPDDVIANTQDCTLAELYQKLDQLLPWAVQRACRNHMEREIIKHLPPRWGGAQSTVRTLR